MVQARIRVINYDESGSEVEKEIIQLDQKDQFSIGRSQAADIKVMDIKVSRSHCRIEKRGDKFYITDLGSRNGTYVNGDRITTHELSNGDNIKVGFSILRYELPEDASRKKLAKEVAEAETPPPEAVHSCHMCNVQITESEMSIGQAEEIAGKVYCAACVKKTDELFRQALVDDSAEIDDDVDIPASGSLADLIEEDDDEAELDLLPDD
ncbi:MAG: FHA domain-containing protein [Planctomycetota bacterium]|nr:MAG: FHA domain-containing protein [Planctomycetota bacterium]